MSEQIHETYLELQDAPDIPGLRFRRYHGESDLPGMLQVILGSKEADGIERADTLEEMRHAYTHLTNCDPHQDMILAEVDGELIAYNRTFWSEEVEGDWVYSLFGFILPTWRRKGIGGAMLRAMEKRIAEIAADHPEGPRYYQSWAADTELGARALLEREGYAAMRWGYEMVRDLSEPIPDHPLPGGVELRPVHRDQDQAIWEAHQEAFRDHWGYREPVEGDFEAWRTLPIHNRDLWQVAWEGKDVVGMVLNFVNENENQAYERLRGYTEDICVRKPWRRQGVAGALIARSLLMLREMGFTEAALGVDTQNRTGALRLYESLGYRVRKEFATYRKAFR